METKNSTARKNRNPNFTFVITPELRERLQALAESESRSPGNLARLALENYLTSKGF